MYYSKYQQNAVPLAGLCSFLLRIHSRICYVLSLIRLSFEQTVIKFVSLQIFLSFLFSLWAFICFSSNFNCIGFHSVSSASSAFVILAVVPRIYRGPKEQIDAQKKA